MPRYKVSRAFVTRFEWTVEAESEEAALAMLDDDSKTPTDSADENWLGPLWGVNSTDEGDGVELIE